MMAQQLGLSFALAPALVLSPGSAPAADASLDAKFERFHRSHPGVYRMLRELAFAGLRRGDTRLGMKGFFETVRATRPIASRGERFGLNNSYSSRYARLLAADEPALARLFETRPLRRKKP